MTDLPTPALLRAQVAALPEHLRVPWKSFAEQVYVEHNGNDHVFAWASEPLRSQMPETAEHIAIVASPPVVLALADLLETAQTPNEYWLTLGEMEAWAIRVQEARDALEAAIHRTPPARAPEGQQA